MGKCLFIFRRDLRLEDNTGLFQALRLSDVVIPCFIFTPQQIENNPYRSDHCLQFMIESLEDLALQLKDQGGKLYLFYGEPDEIIEKCIINLKIDRVIVNRDYTPYSQARDDKIEKVCKKRKITFSSFDDVLLHPPEDTLKSDGKPYSIFTPYYRAASMLPVELPEKISQNNYYTLPIEFSVDESVYKKILPMRFKGLAAAGGRRQALKILDGIQQFVNYDLERDFPAKQKTTGLSPYLKFTVISPREAYYAISGKLGKDHELIRALFWRDFFTHIAFFNPHVFDGAFHKKYDKLKWSYNPEAFARWCLGTTGFPIVDAGMREMNQTGFMHNRVRMIAASFLTKDLHINWREGEKYFAQTLIDYDPAVNNGNWQWAASTGCDAQPYFRIFNPWNQQVKFDKDCEYIKKWIPELKGLEPSVIHQWHKAEVVSSAYIKPMLRHEKEAKIALELYSQVHL